ncbi:CsiV family protein [Microbulbifer spongiae]|uniref:Peptidoglycan binding protein CsiV n=1 Tax=Microbulbifer spongiae TaxID=2944933 RepID=A0ABY9E9L3_9GAMM|nr:CsiV family protein [Microbulbifer sp. MI-G]WKD48194.1 peptidoglycan binding protein CsiV [Microbulbifer sp. MI-G]
MMNRGHLATRITCLFPTLALVFSAAAAQAANYAGNTFEVEMIVFERPQGMARSGESWPASLRLQYPAHWVDFDTRTATPEVEETLSLIASPKAGNLFGSNLSNGEAQQPAATAAQTVQTEIEAAPSLFLSPVPTLLNNKVAALIKGGERILFHKAWRQVLQQKHNSPAVLIHGGDHFRGYRQLEGSVTLSVSRYLHLSTDLWLSDFSLLPEAEGILLPKRPRVDTTEFTEATIPNHQGDNQLPHTGPALRNKQLAFGEYEPGAPEQEQPLYVAHVARLQHERRMRSGKLHYIDHPAFGILIEIRTVPGQQDEELREKLPVEAGAVAEIEVP